MAHPPLAPVFRPLQSKTTNPEAVPSSSPGFGTPQRPVTELPTRPLPPAKAVILPILLPPASLRPLAFRTFTKKHNLTISSSTLQALATFVGKHCGVGWREEGLAEPVLEEIAKSWKKNGGALIVEGSSEELKSILKNVAGGMVAGRLVHTRQPSRQASFALGVAAADDGSASRDRIEGRPRASHEDSQTSLGLSELAMGEGSESDDEPHNSDPRAWLKVIGAFEQPRMAYDAGKKHFERENHKASLLPPASHKTHLFHHRFNVIRQRVLRNESFQRPSLARAGIPSLQRSFSTDATVQRFYKLTPIANLLGRSGSSHLLLGLLTIAPIGTLAICDLTGSISLDLRQAKPVPENGSWFAPGMIVLVDGVYEEEYKSAGGVVGNSGGVGGTIGGTFVAFSIGGPPCEKRDVTLGLSASDSEEHFSSGGGFGWVDFLGVGSERAMGSKMRKLEKRVFHHEEVLDLRRDRSKMLILGELHLDNPSTLDAVKKILGEYASCTASNAPMAIILAGNFAEQAVLAGGTRGGSIEYKESFNLLAAILSEFPALLRNTSFIFLPGDNDPWASAFSAGACTVIPRQAVPDLFTSRIKRAFASANAETGSTTGKKSSGEAVWTTNPARISLFGPCQEIVLFRDDISGRLRRSALHFRPSDQENAVASTQAAATDADAQPPPPEPMDVDGSINAAESRVASESGPDDAGLETPTISDHVLAARKLVKTILDQGHLSPFPLATRPVAWDYVSSLQLYPLPTALVLVDPEMPAFTVTYEGCHVMNPGPLVIAGRRPLARWVEYDAKFRRSVVKEVEF
ncbi:MAG: DNA-directed DNA polymerase epsilon, subunit B [Phylliscum demangeonii]|nr:MAG: DNA-directed DNA polymerase epsilon, subunit B [Phylliscum demangeonii]